jgi:allantoinase
MAQAYRQQGYASTIEACIHYLMLDEENDVKRLLGRGKVNPPIRQRKETEALWAHLAAGNVTVVSTDHVSWSADRKDDPDMLRNASGMPGLEVLYPLLLKGLYERGLSFTHAARVLAENPARLFRLDHAKGALAVGRDADVTLVRHDPYAYRPEQSGANVVSWSAYEGVELPFRVDSSFLRGQPIFADGKVLAEPGMGRFLAPQRACR